MVKDKVIVVTGSGGGIGRDFALALAAEGAKVVVNDIGTSVTGEGKDAGPAQKVVDEIKAAGGQAVANTDSVSEWDSANRIVKTAIDTYGRIDGVINNAGILRDRFFFNMSPEEWKAVIDVHLNGSFYVSRAAAPYFKSQGSGAYVHMTSTSGILGNTGQANYGAAKTALTTLSKIISLDMAKYNVRSNCIAPFAWSRMTSSVPSETPEQKLRIERFKRMESAKVAPLAVFLMSDQASYVNAQVFGVRANEIYLFSQTRILRSVHNSNGWTPESIAETGMPSLKDSLVANLKSGEVITWDPF